VDALAAQLRDLQDLVAGLSDADFTLPTRCPGWTVAEVVAHCEGMLIRLVGENAEPADGEPVVDRVGYYHYDPDRPREGDAGQKTLAEEIRDRGIVEAAGRTGAELRAAFSVAIEEALMGVRGIPAQRVIERPGHQKMTFEEFVASRNVEFGVHAMDIANAVGEPERVNVKAAVIIIGILDGLLGASLPDELGWDVTQYILTGTGRREMTSEERQKLGELGRRFPLLR